MTGSRRRFLKVAGAGGAILAAAGGSWALTRDPAKGRAPWTAAGSAYPDPLRNALSYAILAPNPHNTQPWVVELKSDLEAILHCETRRLLRATDPYDRQITIGLGAFLEVLRLAAAAAGHRAIIDPFPEGSDPGALDARPVAAIRLEPDAQARPDPLFAAVLDRRTDRSRYDTARLPAGEALADIASAGAVAGVRSWAISDPGSVSALRDLTWRAWVVEAQTPHTLQESIDWMRIGRSEIEQNPDGLSLAGPFLEAMALAGVLTREKIADPASVAFRETRDFQKPGIESAMAYAVIATAENDRTDQIAAGAAYVRANLAATTHGVSMQPLSQALQEYPEMAALYGEARRLLAAPGETVQMLARLGYGAGAKPAPRWPLETKIKS